MFKRLHYIACLLSLAAIVFPVFKSIGGNIGPFEHFKLLPQPQKIEIVKSEGLLYSALRNVYTNNPDSVPVLAGLPGQLPFTQQQGIGTISLIIKKELGLPSPEGYILQVSNKQVIIEATRQSGLFYGVQTLNQLIEDAQDQQLPIPACKITDYPKIPVRAVHIDLKNHTSAGNYIYSVIDRLAAVKVNNIIIEFEDKLRYSKAKEVGTGDAISVEEFVAISKYAKNRFIEISPLVQGLGHAAFILKHDAYKELRDDPSSDWAFDPLNPKTYELQFSLYEDAIAATPFGKYLHIGGDEVGKLGKSALSKSSGKTPLELQMYWLTKVTDFATAHNRIPIFWDDMVFKLAGLYQTTYDSLMDKKEVMELWAKSKPRLDSNIVLFPKKCIYMRWNYEAPNIPGNVLALDWYKSHGLEVMPATSAQEHFVIMQRNQSNFVGIKGFCRLSAEKKLAAILCTVWDDSAPHFETTWRGLYDFAWFSWNDRDYTEPIVHARFRQRFFSAAVAGEKFEFENMLEDALNFWDTAFIVNGDRENYHDSLNLIELPGASQKAGQWSLSYKERISQAKKTVALYDEIKNRINQSKALSRRNRYALDIMEQINELQVYSARLLLLLHGYDIASSAGSRKIALQQVKQYADQFSIIRERYEKVYAVTRILGHPEGYKLDMNLHAHFANSTMNTDWMYSFEIPMNRKLSLWLDAAGSN